MKRIRIYTDEDITISVCKALRLRGFEAFATIEDWYDIACKGI